MRIMSEKGTALRTPPCLRSFTLDSFYALKREAAPGVDGMTWKEYETDLDKRLEDLHSRVPRGAYRALAVFGGR